MDNNKITFIASFPPIDSAMKINGQGDGARIQMDIPGSELGAIIRLHALCGHAFKVTIEKIEQDKLNQSKVKYIK